MAQCPLTVLAEPVVTLVGAEGAILILTALPRVATVKDLPLSVLLWRHGLLTYPWPSLLFLVCELSRLACGGPLGWPLPFCPVSSPCLSE